MVLGRLITWLKDAWNRQWFQPSVLAIIWDRSGQALNKETGGSFSILLGPCSRVSHVFKTWDAVDIMYSMNGSWCSPFSLHGYQLTHFDWDCFLAIRQGLQRSAVLFYSTNRVRKIHVYTNTRTFRTNIHKKINNKKQILLSSARMRGFPVTQRRREKFHFFVLVISADEPLQEPPRHLRSLKMLREFLLIDCVSISDVPRPYNPGGGIHLHDHNSLMVWLRLLLFRLSLTLHRPMIFSDMALINVSFSVFSTNIRW